MNRKKAQAAQKAMNLAEDYHSWYAAAVEYDLATGKEEWKKEDESPSYHYELIRKRLNELKQADKTNDIKEAVYSLKQGLVHDFGNITNPALYFHTATGTKHLITDYVHEVAIWLRYLCDTPFEDFPHAEKLIFFQHASQSYGRSALLLSGGGPFGIFHLGTIKTLLEHRLLPHVVSGSSIGSVIASILGTQTTQELSVLFEQPTRLFERNIMKPPKKTDFMRQKGFMDFDSLITYVVENVGLITFEEAYKKTNRVLNISMSPAYENQHPYLTNYLTTPHVTIRSAVQASCSVPGMYKPATLSAKNSKGKIVPYMESLKWVDGSMANDLPMSQLSEMFNINHHIVSLVNPLIFPFASTQDQKVMGMLRRLGRSEFRHRLHQILEIAISYQNQKKRAVNVLQARGNTEVSLLRLINGMLDQQYRGDITIFPPRNLKKFYEILQLPIPENYKRGILEGERATWKKVEMIRNQVLISQTLDDCLHQLQSQ
ncbi:patatin-like phospholipase family protein [Deltaproteobacteria bacterium TL4]